MIVVELGCCCGAGVTTVVGAGSRTVSECTHAASARNSKGSIYLIDTLLIAGETS